VTLVEELEVIAMEYVAVQTRSLLEASELTYTQSRVPVVIASSPDVWIGSLGAHLGAPQSATSRLVRALEGEPSVSGVAAATAAPTGMTRGAR
jgi:DNA-binding MarR family transcriptional regulator